jgi:phosphoglycolate phosphatase-like HAD superfamily hydrolase
MDASPIKPVILVDVDNTVIDTAYRKQKALKRHLNIEASLEKIRSDYKLVPILGQGGEVADKFVNSLDAVETLTEFEAPAFPGAAESIALLRRDGFEILFVTARHSGLRALTIAELVRNGIPCSESELLTPPEPNHAREFKFATIRRLSLERQVLAVIGDRPDDIEAACEAGLPAILFKSTLRDSEIEALLRDRSEDITVCRSWTEVSVALQKLESGTAQMAALRTMFTQQYSAWLRDIDEKIKIVVAVAAVIVAFCGNELRVASQPYDFGWWLLLLILVTSSLSTIYAIRGFTSRYSSGRLSSDPIRTYTKQWLAILLGRPKSWLYLPNDVMSDYRALVNAPEREQATAHLRFFYNKYKTHDPEALLNLRMAELHAANYSKLYAERIASKLLICSIALTVAWALRGVAALFARSVVCEMLKLFGGR